MDGQQLFQFNEKFANFRAADVWGNGSVRILSDDTAAAEIPSIFLFNDATKDKKYALTLSNIKFINALIKEHN